MYGEQIYNAQLFTTKTILVKYNISDGHRWNEIL